MLKNFSSALITAIIILALQYIYIGPEKMELAKLIFMTVCTFLLITALERKKRKQEKH